ncbi:MAG: PD-(D/E)XK nuclease family protein, partial [Candidatus Latescibacterota bacterium]
AEARFLKGEELRLLYVAATRAENLLVVSMYEGQTDKGPWASLYPFLKDIPDLADYPSAELVIDDKQAMTLTQLQEDRDQFWTRVKTPTYAVNTVTTDRSDAFVTRSGTRRGAAYGTVIHQLFDDAIHKRLPDTPENYVRYLLVDAGGDANDVADAIDALQAFWASDIWRDLQMASAVYTEVPFAVLQDNTVIRGVVDLVYQLSDGWYIVDYKTDAVQTEDEVNGLVAQVVDQIESYAYYCERVGGVQMFVAHRVKKNGGDWIMRVICFL